MENLRVCINHADPDSNELQHIQDYFNGCESNIRDFPPELHHIDKATRSVYKIRGSTALVIGSEASSKEQNPFGDTCIDVTPTLDGFRKAIEHNLRQAGFEDIIFADYL